MSTGARTNVGDNSPPLMRATLRAPPSKWALKGFFPAGERSEPRSRTARRAPADRSPRRIATWAASGVAVPRAFFGTFFRFERKYYPLRGGSPTVRAGVGASSSTRGKGYAPAGAPKGFPRGKQSARAALPCAPIAICLHPSGSFPKRNELPSKRPALPSHEGGSSPFSHQNRAALLFGKRPMFIFVC